MSDTRELRGALVQGCSPAGFYSKRGLEKGVANESEDESKLPTLVVQRDYLYEQAMAYILYGHLLL